MMTIINEKSCHELKQGPMSLTDTIEKRRANLRTQLLLNGPIVSTLFRLSWPNILVMLAQTSTGLVETYLARAARAEEFRKGHEQMDRQEEQIAHKPAQ
jgi:hypothetical protein